MRLLLGKKIEAVRAGGGRDEEFSIRSALDDQSLIPLS
jgi:hypothetical protein